MAFTALTRLKTKASRSPPFTTKGTNKKYMSQPVYAPWLRIALIPFCLLLLVALLFFSLHYCLLATDLFEEEYTRLDHARRMGMSTDDLVRATQQMVAYMAGRADSIDLEVTVNGAPVSMFNDRERAHMVDVRALYLGWKRAASFFVALFFAAVVFAFALLKRRAVCQLARSFSLSSGLFLALLVFLGAWVLLDFSSFWTNFHYLFFSNDLWQLDPATSRMINMMPLELFYAIVLRIAETFLLVWALLWGLSAILAGKDKRCRQYAS